MFYWTLCIQSKSGDTACGERAHGSLMFICRTSDFPCNMVLYKYILIDCSLFRWRILSGRMMVRWLSSATRTALCLSVQLLVSAIGPQCSTLKAVLSLVAFGRPMTRRYQSATVVNSHNITRLKNCQLHKIINTWSPIFLLLLQLFLKLFLYFDFGHISGLLRSDKMHRKWNMWYIILSSKKKFHCLSS